MVIKNNNNSFANNLKNILKERNITQHDLAVFLNVREATICRYCLGQNEPNYDTLVKIALYLKVSTDELLGVKSIDTSISRSEYALLNEYRSLPENGKVIAKKQIEILKKNL